MSDKMVKEFIESRQEEVNTKTIDFVKAVIEIEKEIKELRKDINTITNEAKEEQVNVKLAKKAIARLKYLMKTSEEDIDEEDTILEALRSNSDVVGGVSEIIAK